LPLPEEKSPFSAFSPATTSSGSPDGDVESKLPVAVDSLPDASIDLSVKAQSSRCGPTHGDVATLF
jgi:hypothetical protein